MGLIPARAGRTSSTPTAPCSAEAHPRAGGEDVDRVGQDRPQEGSSPRGRGGRVGCWSGSTDDRLIPARAGRTLGRRRRCSRTGAHPRAGGEDVTYVVQSITPNGSSPRGRGGRVRAGSSVAGRGLIPARAGRTGEAGQDRDPCAGSSPRGRGGHERRAVETAPARLIPARAGRTRAGVGADAGR